MSMWYIYFKSIFRKSKDNFKIDYLKKKIDLLHMTPIYIYLNCELTKINVRITYLVINHELKQNIIYIHMLIALKNYSCRL